MIVLLVALGAAIGAPLRYLVDWAVQARHDSLFPWGTICGQRRRGPDGRRGVQQPMVTTEDARWLASYLRKMVSTRPAAWVGTEMSLS